MVLVLHLVVDVGQCGSNMVRCRTRSAQCGRPVGGAAALALEVEDTDIGLQGIAAVVGEDVLDVGEQLQLEERSEYK